MIANVEELENLFAGIIEIDRKRSKLSKSLDVCDQEMKRAESLVIDYCRREGLLEFVYVGDGVATLVRRHEEHGLILSHKVLIGCGRRLGSDTPQ